MNPSPSGESESGWPSDPYRWVILTFATLAQAGTAFLFLGVGALAGFVQEAFDLTGAQTGLLVAAVGLAPLFALLPTGRMLDRRSERAIITGGALLLAAGTALASAGQSYVWLLIPLMVGGTGYSASQPGGSMVVAAWFPTHQRGLAMGVRQTGLPLGGALAAAVLPMIADRSDWRAAFLVAAAVAAGSGVIFGLVYRAPAVAAFAAVPGFRSELRGLLRMKTVRLAMQSGLAMVSMQFAIISYLMLYLRDVHSVPLTRGAWMLFGAQGAGAAGRIALAAWSDRASHRMVSVAVAAGAAAVGALLYGVMSAGVSFVLLLLISTATGFFAFGWYGPWIVFVAESAPPHAIGMTLALAMVANQLAIVIVPPLFGLLVDITGGYSFPWLAVGGFLVLVATRVGRATRVDGGGVARSR